MRAHPYHGRVGLNLSFTTAIDIWGQGGGAENQCANEIIFYRAKWVLDNYSFPRA